MAIVPTADVETRKKPRSRVLDTGLIRFGDVSVPCVIRNLSETVRRLGRSASECCPRSVYIDCGPHKENPFLHRSLAQRSPRWRLILLKLPRSMIEGGWRDRTPIKPRIFQILQCDWFPRRRNRHGNSTRKFSGGVFTQPGPTSDIVA